MGKIIQKRIFKTLQHIIDRKKKICQLEIELVILKAIENGMGTKAIENILKESAKVIKNKKILLDLFCKAGGAAAGYKKAGFYVVGVDIVPQPNYCGDEFYQCDAIEFLKTKDLSRFDVFHASPPCQAHTKVQQLAKARNGGKYREHPDYIEAIRQIFETLEKPYIIENVSGAPLHSPLKLSGTQFQNLYTQRQRLFESNITLKDPDCTPTKKKTPPAGWGFGDDGFISICGSGGIQGMNSKQIPLYWGFALGGIDWMTRDELAEAIPPAYTEFIGKQIQEHIKLN